jgi:lysophospholipase L1-like esterase
MKRLFAMRLVLLLPLFLFYALSACRVLAAEHPVTVALVGDSTVNDEGGWGPGFAASFDAKVKTINFAKNGRSSKSFRSEGLWTPVLAAKPAWVLIQFGHNDCPGKGPDRETDPQTTFRANMIRYVAEARAVGTSPILITSIVRRNFESNGTIKRDCLVPYVEEVRKIASEKSVPLIDLYALTLAQAERLGPAKTASLNAVKPDGSSDTTHLGRIGQREIGAIAAREFARIVPSLRPSVHGTAGTAGISEIFPAGSVSTLQETTHWQQQRRTSATF